MKIICVTGTRADYGIYYPLLKALNNDNQFELKLLVTGMHLVSEYGKTIQKIQQENFEIIATPSILFKGDSTHAMSQSIGLAVIYFADIFNFHKPDFILLLGDRGEMLAAAIAAHYQNIGIIHLHGGEKSGSADDSVRHAISKFAHIHFVATAKSKDNLIKLGETEWRIVAVGTLRKSEIKYVKNLNALQRDSLIKKYKLDNKKRKILIVIHPDSKEKRTFEQQIMPVLNALTKFEDTDLIFLGPNSDAGGDRFRKKILEFIETKKNSYYYSSIPSLEYLFLLSQMDLLIGNTSSGIIEAPFFNLPFLNIGNRQKDREQGDNVINVENDEEKIIKQISTVLQMPLKTISFNPYDLAEAPEKEIVRKLKQLIISPEMLDKK